MTLPYIGFANETLERLPPLKAGDVIVCPKCGNAHTVEDSVPPLLLFYKCGDSSYMAGLNGRSTIGVRSDVSGSIPSDAD